MGSLSFSEPPQARAPSNYSSYPAAAPTTPYDPQYYASPYPQPVPPRAPSVRRPASNVDPNMDRAHAQVQEKCLALEKDNEELRAYIATMRSAQGPIHDDGYYVQGIERLNYQIQSWVVKMTKSVSNTQISYYNAESILKGLEELGDNGEETLDMLRSGNTSLQKLYSQPRTRIALVRHVIALFFFDRIFDPFAFGLDEDKSELLWDIQDGIFSQGFPL
jgi:hypothetical protein